MKQPAPDAKIEHLIDRIRRLELLDADQVRAMLDRWQREAGESAEASRFARWLVARHYLTDAQAESLFREHATLPPVPPVPEGVMNAVIVAAAASPRPRAGVHVASAAVPVDPLETPSSSPVAPPMDIDVALVSLSPSPPEFAPLTANVWLYVFLGGVGLFAVQCVGWVLAQVAARLL